MRSRGLRAARGAGVALLALGAALAGQPAAAGATATLPPDLVALEQQMAQLQVNSERFDFQEEVSLGGLLGARSAPLVLIVAGEGEGSDSPAESTATAGLAGVPEVRLRTFGRTTFTYEKQAGEIDGGRPWVRSAMPAESDAGLDPGGLLENDQGGAQGTFSALIAELNGALSIEESGPVTVDDQRVIEFDAALDPAPVLAQLKSESKQPQHPLSSPLETSPVGSEHGAKPSAPPSLELELFIAPSGLPVRARVTFTDEGASIALRVDTLAVNIPVHVQRPPARRTIGAARLERIERRRAARQLARALRACRRLHGKRAKQCRALAHLKSGASASPEASLL